MKRNLLLLSLSLAILTSGSVHAQLTASAGFDLNFCIGDSVVIGGTPTATGGSPPYTYAWYPLSGPSYFNDSTLANPYAYGP